jgi:hypothetical protein
MTMPADPRIFASPSPEKASRPSSGSPNRSLLSLYRTFWHILPIDCRKARLVASSGDPQRIKRLIAILVAAAPAACTFAQPPQAENPFIGTWVTAESTSITIRPDTIVQHQPDGQTTALDKTACRGVFHFAYGTKTRQALTGLAPRQPELRQRLSDLLVEPTYPVAELDCDRGDQTYVLLNDRQLVAIYRDGDIGAIDRLARR